MTSEEPTPEEEDEASFLHRLEMIKDLIEAPDEVIEAIYDGYGKSMLYTAGGAAGAAAGVAVGGPVGGIVGGVVGKKPQAGSLATTDQNIPKTPPRLSALILTHTELETYYLLAE